MKNLIKLLILIVALSASVFACGAPQPVSGRIVASDALEAMLLISRGVVVRVVESLEEPSIFDKEGRVNAFGYFTVQDVTPCLEFIVAPRVVNRKFSDYHFTFEPETRLIYVVGDHPPEFQVFGVSSSFYSSEVLK